MLPCPGRLVGQVERLLPGMGLSLGKDLSRLPELLPAHKKTWSPKEMESARTKHIQWPTPASRSPHVLCKASCPCFETLRQGSTKLHHHRIAAATQLSERA